MYLLLNVIVLYLTTEFDQIRSFSSKLIDSNWFPAFKGLLFFSVHSTSPCNGTLGNQSFDCDECSWRCEQVFQGWRYYGDQGSCWIPNGCWKPSFSWTEWWKVKERAKHLKFQSLDNFYNYIIILEHCCNTIVIQNIFSNNCLIGSWLQIVNFWFINIFSL